GAEAGSGGTELAAEGPAVVFERAVRRGVDPDGGTHAALRLSEVVGPCPGEAGPLAQDPCGAGAVVRGESALAPPGDLVLQERRGQSGTLRPVGQRRSAQGQRMRC